MDQENIGGYKEIQPVPCCTKCGMPKDEVLEAFREVIAVKCIKCHATIATGSIVALRAKCYKCGAFISVV